LRAVSRPASGAAADSDLASRSARVRLRARRFTPLAEAIRTLFGAYRQRTLVGLTLMAAQAFFYNAIFLPMRHSDRFLWRSRATGSLVPSSSRWEFFLGPALLGRLFDTIGRQAR